MEKQEKNNAAAAENIPPAAEQTPENGEAWDAQEEIPEVSAAETTAETAVEPSLTPEAVLQAEVDALKDQMLRKEADFQNYRKRMAREVSDARRVGLVETITPFLQVFDLFAMAIKAAETSDNIAALKQGLAMILTQYEKTIDELGVQKFDAPGQQFDPEWHDAVAYENSDDIPEGTVIKQWNCGYKLGDRLLRPARVIVSSGPAAGEAENTENSSNADSESTGKQQ